MDHLVQAERLEAAAAFVDRVIADLNEVGSKCEHCGLTTREDFHQYQMGVSLRAMADRLRRYAVGQRRLV
jgi:Fe-S oxidoreductase